VAAGGSLLRELQEHEEHLCGKGVVWCGREAHLIVLREPKSTRAGSCVGRAG
jgi:hypothetical protein